VEVGFNQLIRGENLGVIRQPRVRVVVADDDPDILRLLLSRLRSRGYEPIAAADGDQALYAVRTLRPEAAIVDWIMPGVHGAAVCAQLKADVSTSHIPIVMLTSRSDEAAIEHAFACGADDYLTKPFDVDELDGVLRSLVRTSVPMRG